LKAVKSTDPRRSVSMVSEIMRNNRETQGTRLTDGEAGVLSKQKFILSREQIVRGAYKMISTTTARTIGTGRASNHIAVNGHFMWIFQDHAHKRGGELLRYVKPGGMFLYEHVGKGVGPDAPTDVVFMHNRSKTNVDNKFLEYAHVWEAVDEHVICCGILALFVLLVMDFELNDVKLDGDCGWHYVPLIAGEKKNGTIPPQSVMSSSTHTQLFN